MTTTTRPDSNARSAIHHADLKSPHFSEEACRQEYQYLLAAADPAENARRRNVMNDAIKTLHQVRIDTAKAVQAAEAALADARDAVYESEQAAGNAERLKRIHICLANS